MEKRHLYVIFVFIGLIIFTAGPLYTIKYGGLGCPDYNTGKLGQCSLDQIMDQYWPILISFLIIVSGLYFYKKDNLHK